MLRAGAGDNLQVGTSRLEALPAAPGGPPTQPEHQAGSGRADLTSSVITGSTGTAGKLTDEPVVGRREYRERSASGEMERQKRARVRYGSPGRESSGPPGRA